MSQVQETLYTSIWPDDGSKTSFRNVVSPRTKPDDGQCPIYVPI